jgi:hypothetical protein
LGEYPIAFLEVNRRFLWTLLRVEHEHLNNCDQLKALSSLKLPLEDLFYKKDYGDGRENDTEEMDATEDVHNAENIV